MCVNTPIDNSGFQDVALRDVLPHVVCVAETSEIPTIFPDFSSSLTSALLRNEKKKNCRERGFFQMTIMHDNSNKKTALRYVLHSARPKNSFHIEYLSLPAANISTEDLTENLLWCEQGFCPGDFYSIG